MTKRTLTVNVACKDCGEPVSLRPRNILRRIETAGVFRFRCSKCRFYNTVAHAGGVFEVTPLEKNITRNPVKVDKAPLQRREFTITKPFHGYTGCPITGYDFKYF